MPTKSQQEPDAAVDILHVEDNLGDIRLTEEAFKTAGDEVNILAVTTGDEALDCLSRQATDEARTLPDIVLVDLNLPGKDGCDVLESIREDPQLDFLPVIMFSSSESREDISRCYDARANAYLTKPNSPDRFNSLVEAIEKFWLGHVRLPPQ